MKQKVIIGTLTLLVSGVVGAGLATGAGATETGNPPPAAAGNIEICKASVPGTLAVTGPFSFTITNGPTVSVTAGLCSPEIAVSGSEIVGGVVTITEALSPWYAVTSIGESAGGSYLTGYNLGLQTATVTVSPSTVSTVTYTDTIVPGYLEVCKAAAATSGLTGTYYFNVTGADGWLNGAPAAAKAAAIAVNIGSSSCSGPIEMPAGKVTVTEAGTNLYVTSLTATSGVSPNATNELDTGTNLTTGTAVVTVLPENNTSNETIVSYTDDVVNFKVCKAAFVGVEPGGSSTTFPFSFVVSGVAGPANPLPNVSLPAGACSNPVAFRAGTEIAVTEGMVPGTKVESISTDGIAESVLPGSLSAPNGTITVFVGTPVSDATQAPGNEAVVTYQDEAAAPGELKLCKYAGVGPTPIGTVFSFNVSGVATPVLVSLNSCTIVGTYPFNSTVSITEAPSMGNGVSAINLSSSTDVTENSGATATDEPALTYAASALMSASSAGTGISSVIIGENVITEVNYFDVDPPIVVSTPGVSVGVGPTTTATSSSVTSGISTSGISTSGISNSGISSIAASTLIGATNALPQTLTKAQIKAELKKLNSELTTIKKDERAAATKLSHLKGKAHKAELVKVRALQERVSVLRTEIGLL